MYVNVSPVIRESQIVSRSCDVSDVSYENVKLSIFGIVESGED